MRSKDGHVVAASPSYRGLLVVHYYRNVFSHLRAAKVREVGMLKAIHAPEPGGPAAGVREDAFVEQDAAGDPIEHQSRAVAILHTGVMNLDAQHQAERFGDEVTFAALDPLSGVEAAHITEVRIGFHALAVDDRRGRALRASLQFPGPAIESVVDVRPDPQAGRPRSPARAAPGSKGAIRAHSRSVTSLA
jgi:hypothetical protein